MLLMQVRDVALSIGFQHYGRKDINGKSVAFHEPWLTDHNVPALSRQYGDVFPAINVFARGPNLPRLNIENCISGEPQLTPRISCCAFEDHDWPDRPVCR
jgi:hypothetical protein